MNENSGDTGTPLAATIAYRPMVAGDIAAACALWSLSEGVELAEGDSEAELVRYLARNPGASHVAVRDGTMVGAVLAGHDGRRGLVYHLAVARAARGAGVGRELVDRSLACLKAAGITRALLLVARDNIGGSAFWRRRGWDALEFAEPMGIDL